MKIVTQADFSDCLALQKKLVQAADKLSVMAGDVAKAKHVREFHSDRAKRCLAIAALPFLKAGLSSAAADTEARGGDAYGESMKQLGKEYVAAEAVLASWEATKIQVETSRSLLAMQRDLSRNL